jgi:hypothetical protein
VSERKHRRGIACARSYARTVQAAYDRLPSARKHRRAIACARSHMRTFARSTTARDCVVHHDMDSCEKSACLGGGCSCYIHSDAKTPA